MTSVENLAIRQTIRHLDPLLNLPGQGKIVLDASDADADISNLFIERGCETARFDDLGLPTPNLTYIQGVASATGLPDGSLDMVAIAGAQAREIRRDVLFESGRVLKPQASLLLTHAAPVVLPGTVTALSDAVMLQFNPFWKQTADIHAISPTLSNLAMAGFVGGESHSLDTSLSFTTASWVDYCCASVLIKDARLSSEEMNDFRLVLDSCIRRDFGIEEFYVPFRTLAFLAFKAN